MILGIVKEPEVGEEYEGEVVGIKDFGAFIKLTPGKDGLLHISRVANGRVGKVEDVLEPRATSSRSRSSRSIRTPARSRSTASTSRMPRRVPMTAAMSVASVATATAATATTIPAVRTERPVVATSLS